MPCSVCHETNSVRYVRRGSALEPVPCAHGDPRAEPCACGFGELRCAWCERPLGAEPFRFEGAAYCDPCALALGDATVAELARGTQ